METYKNWKGLVYLTCMIQIGAGISIIGIMAFLPLFLTELGVDDPGEAAFWAGLMTGVTPLMVALSGPFWAMQVAKRGVRTVMIIVLASVALSSFLTGMATAPWQVLLFRTIQGLTGGFVPTGLAVITLVTPEEKTPWAMGYFQAAMVSGIMFGPLLGGLLADHLGYRMPFFVFGTLALFCLAGVWKYMPALKNKAANKGKESSFSQVMYFMAIPRVRIMTFMQFLCNFGITGIGPILPLYIKNEIGGDMTMVATVVGIIIFLAGGVSAMSSLSVGRVTGRFRMDKVLLTSTLFVGFTFVMQYMMSSVYGLGLWRALTGLGMGMIAPCTNTIIAKSVPVEKRSIVFGTVSSLFLMGNVAGPVCSGALASWMGYSAVFWSTALAFWIAAIFIYWNFRKDPLEG